jgi:hypothetical protein
VTNVELDTNATALPPTIYTAWVLRRDQADRLAAAVRDDPPEESSERDATLMLVEARAFGRVASVWVNARGDAIDEYLHTHGRELLARLGADARDVSYALADVRGLDEHGHPAQRNTACPCGSGRKAKSCAHHGPPTFFSTAWLFLHQEEWDRFVADEDDFPRPDIPMMARGHARVGVRHHTLANKTLGTLTTDFAVGLPPFLPWTLLTETASTLSTLVVDQVPFLRGAKAWLTVARPDSKPRSRYDPSAN